MTKWLLILALALPAHAAPPRWIASVVAVVAGVTLDVASSQGRYEANPLLRGPNGQISMSRAIVLKGGAIGGGILLQWVYARRHREVYRPFAWVNAGVAGALVGVSVRNWRVPRVH